MISNYCTAATTLGDMMTPEGQIMFGQDQYMSPGMMPLSTIDTGYPPPGGMGGNLHS